MDKTVIRGDTYVLRRKLFYIEIVDEDLNPFDLAGCTVRSTFKAAPTDPSVDTTDTTGYIKATIVFNEAGTVTSSSGLALQDGTTALDGMLVQTLTSTQSKALPVDVDLFSDVEITDADGEVFTVIMTGKLVAIDGYTNRVTG